MRRTESEIGKPGGVWDPPVCRGSMFTSGARTGTTGAAGNAADSMWRSTATATLFTASEGHSFGEVSVVFLGDGQQSCLGAVVTVAQLAAQTPERRKRRAANAQLTAAEYLFTISEYIRRIGACNSKGIVVVWLFLLLACSCLAEVTFTRDIAPILQKHCQVCHRPGEIGPMPLLTYKQARPWAKAIREAVQLRKMPPWFADRRFGEFANDPSLTPEEVAKVERWVEEGSKEGDPKDAPAEAHWPSGWAAQNPDMVISMPHSFPIPANAVIEYQYIILPTHFRTDRWVRLVEIRPSDAGVVHHAVLYVREAGSKWLRSVPKGVMYAPPPSNTEALREARETKADILGVYTPGSPVSSFPEGMAKRVPAGADLILQLHYTAKKTGASDQTRIGLVFAKEPVTKRVLTLQMGMDDIVIPPGDRECRLSRWGTLPREALLLSMLPHMHLRGSGFEYQIVHPRGRIETLLKVNHYDFHWQLSYKLKTPRLLPAGTRLLVTGIFDNSANNPRNPDPGIEVHWGEQSWEEMMIGFFDVAVPPNIDKQAFFVRERN